MFQAEQCPAPRPTKNALHYVCAGHQQLSKASAAGTTQSASRTFLYTVHAKETTIKAMWCTALETSNTCKVCKMLGRGLHEVKLPPSE